MHEAFQKEQVSFQFHQFENNSESHGFCYKTGIFFLKFSSLMYPSKKKKKNKKTV